jgi:hypothetical protein
MLADAHWMKLEPLIETCRPKGKTPPQGQDPAPGSAAHDFGHCLAASERGQVARHPG